MIRQEPDSATSTGSKSKNQWPRLAILGVVCALIIGAFIWSAQPGILESISYPAQESYYNLLVQGFRSGQLNVKREAPPALATLSDPYDPDANSQYVWDQHNLCYEMSYYKGKLYLYFGATAVLVLFWPYEILTGHYLPATDAILIFFSCGLVMAAGLLYAIWRRYFPVASVWIIAAAIASLGLCTGILDILSSCDVYEVAKSCAFAFMMLALVGIYRALHDPKQEIKWLLLASLAYGLAIASRQTLIFGALVLLIPPFQAWRGVARTDSPVRFIALLAAAVCPMAAVGLGLMFYNDLRFDNPLEFGWRYQLTNINQNVAVGPFNLHYLWFNFRFYFLQPAHWSGHYPFLQIVPMPPAPSGYAGIGIPYAGLLCNYPIVWMALAAPLAWHGRRDVPGLRWFVTTLLWLFVACALTLCFFRVASSRYQFDFLPVFILLAIVGILGLEQALAGRVLWRRIVRCAWCLLLAYTAVFNVFAAVESRAATNWLLGNYFFTHNQMDTASHYFQKALVINPECVDAYRGLGCILLQQGQTDQAMVQIQKALQINPDYAEAHRDLGSCLLRMGRMDDAIAETQRAVQLEPETAAFRGALASLFSKEGRMDDAIVQYQKVIEIKPGNAEAHYDLGGCFLQTGQLDLAITEYQKAVSIKPRFVQAYNNLASVYSRKKMAAEAIVCYEKALKLEPQFIPAQVNLAWLLATWPEPSLRNGTRAVTLAETANNSVGGENPLILHALAAAYAESGRFSEARSTAQKALALATAQSNADLARQLSKEIALYQNNLPYHSPKD